AVAFANFAVSSRIAALGGSVGASLGSRCFRADVRGCVRLRRQADTQRWIADQQCRIGLAQHGVQIRRHLEKFRRDLPMPRTQNLCQRLRAPRTPIERNRPRLRNGYLGNQQQTPHAPLRRDRKIRQDHQVIDALILDRRNDRDVHSPGAQRFGTLRRHRKRQIVLALERPVRKAPDQRRGIEILNDGDARFWQGQRFSRRARRSDASSLEGHSYIIAEGSPRISSRQLRRLMYNVSSNCKASNPEALNMSKLSAALSLAAVLVASQPPTAGTNPPQRTSMRAADTAARDSRSSASNSNAATLR